MVDFPTPIIPVKVRFFPNLTSFLILIFHKYVLFIEFKLIHKVCNLNTTDSQKLEFNIKTFNKVNCWLVVIFILVIFLIEKINFPSPEKNIKLMLQMKLKSFNFLLGLLIIFFHIIFIEEKIDIWKNNKKCKENLQNQKEKTFNSQNTNIESSQRYKQ